MKNHKPRNEDFPKNFDRLFRTRELYKRFGEWVDIGGQPHIPALVWADGVATIWCQYCDDIHTHSPESGPRVAHCPLRIMDDGTFSRGTPYEETGYFLEIVAVVNSLEDKPFKRISRQSSSHTIQEPNLSLKERFELLVEHNFRCFYCRKSSVLDGVTLEMDHLIPKSKGGSNAKHNRVPACYSCNRGKGAQEIL